MAQIINAQSLESVNVVNVSMASHKKAINELFNTEFSSPFKVLAWFNKNRNNEHIAAWLTKFGFTDSDGKPKKLALDNLLQFTPDGEELSIFCKLQGVDKKGLAITSFYDESREKVWYYIPIKFSVNEFMRSVESQIALDKKIIKVKAWQADSTKRAEREAKKIKKLNEKVDLLKSKFEGINSADLEAIAKTLGF